MKLLILSLLFFINASAKTHYFASGTDMSICNSTMKDGDSALFERGGVFKGALLSKSYAYYGAYGAGAKPIITSKAIVPNSDNVDSWTDMGKNTWRLAFTSPKKAVHRIWLNGIEYARSKSIKGVDSIKRTMGDFAIDASYLYVYATANPATFYSNIEYSDPIYYTFDLSNHSYITVQNLDIRDGIASIEIENANHIIIDSCIVGKGAARMGIQGSNAATDIVIKNCEIDSDHRTKEEYQVYNGIADGVFLKGGCHRWQVHHNWVHDWGHSNIEIENLYAAGDLTMTNNEFYNNYLTAEFVDYCRAIGADSKLGRNSTGNKFHHNFIEKCNVASQLNCAYLEYSYNITANMTNAPNYPGGEGRGVAISGYNNTAPQYMKITNNIFANCPEAGIIIGGSTAPGYSDIVGNEISNNIFYNNGWDGTGNYYNYPNVQLLIVNPRRKPNTFRNNIIYKSTNSSNLVADFRPTGKGLTYLPVNSFNARSGADSDVIQGNINVDPMLSNDFSLLPGSPALLVGIESIKKDDGIDINDLINGILDQLQKLKKVLQK